LTEAVIELLNDARLRRQLGVEAQATAEKYRVEKIYQRYLTLLERVVAGTSAEEYGKAMIELP
jgi:glycosyltransferase involved in cell wall biosynthesis